MLPFPGVIYVVNITGCFWFGCWWVFLFVVFWGVFCLWVVFVFFL